jgi:hypothetical protein
MTIRTKLWLAPALVYGIFVFWYTDFGGPLSDEEVDNYVTVMTANGSTPETVAYYEKFLREDSGRQFLMVNAIDMTDKPPHIEGAPEGADAATLMGLYMEHMIPELLRRACHPTLMGDAAFTAIDVVGIEGAQQWTGAALFRYRSRRSFMEIISNPDIRGPHHFKLAALDKTIAYPIETNLYLSDPRFLLGLLLLALTALIDALWLARKAPRDSNSTTL